MDPLIRRAVAKIQIVQDGTAVSWGTGTLVADRLVLTALHVVANRKTGTPLPGVIQLTFPGHVTEAKLVDGRHDGQADWALLECEAAPPDVRPVPLCAVSSSGQAFETFGFPETQPRDGMVQRGRVTDHNATYGGIPALQLFSEEAAAGNGAPVKGASGSPVIINKTLVGVLRAALMDQETKATRAGTLYACPAATVVDGADGLVQLHERRRPPGVRPYLDQFDHDVVISYASLDDDPLRPGEPGWVEQFTRQLSLRLRKHFGDRGRVWRHEQGDRADRADAEIEEAVRGAGLLVPLLSNTYLGQIADRTALELDWFRDQADQTGTGLEIENRPRVLPAALYPIPETDWPEMCRGGAVVFHDDVDSKGYGEPLAPDSEAFQERLKELTSTVIDLLTRLRQPEAPPAPAPTAPAPATPQVVTPAPTVVTSAPKAPDTEEREEADTRVFTIFLGCPAEERRRDHRLLRSGLRGRPGIRVLDTLPDPDAGPFDTQGHTEAAAKAITEADLSVHLLGATPGEPIEDDTATSYTVAQAQLALEASVEAERPTPQLVLLPEDFDPALVDAGRYADFLQKLRERERDEARFELAQVGRQQMLDTVFAKQRQLQNLARQALAPSGGPGTAFVDLHPNDLPVAGDLVNFLDGKQVSTVMVPSADRSSVGTARFHDNLREAGLFIVVFGTVAHDWVKFRLQEALHLIVDEGLDTQVGVYAAPPVKAADLLRFGRMCRVADNMQRFDPNTLEPLLGEAGDVS